MQHNYCSTGKFQMLVCLMVVVVGAICAIGNHDHLAEAATKRGHQDTPAIQSIVKRSTGADKKHDDTKKSNSMMHNHLSRKVFDRACAASKDTVDEIVACITDNETLIKSVKPGIAADCHKEAFGVEFDQKDIQKHKEMICNNREKFENMTACIYRQLAESLDTKEMDKLAEAMVDVGLCIINALDG